MRRAANFGILTQRRARLFAHPVSLSLALVSASPVVSPAAAETVTPVFQQALPNVAGKTIAVVTVDFAPASRATPHRHGQAFVYAYVLRGAIRSQLEGQPAQTYAAGQGWAEAPGSHHVLTENPSATEAAQLLVVFVSDSRQPLRTDDRP